MIKLIFNTILYRPLYNALVLLYQFLSFHDLGIAIVLLTLFIRILLYPLSASSLRAQKKISELQPKINAIQKNHKDSKEKTEELLKLYRKEKINPFAGFLPLLLQLPILIALYRVFGKIQEIDPSLLYSFVSNSSSFNTSFLGILNLATPSAPLAFLAAILQYFQTKSIQTKSIQKKPKEGTPEISQMIQKQTLFIFPILTFFILFKLPSAIGVYLVATTLFSLGERWFIKKDKIKDKHA